MSADRPMRAMVLAAGLGQRMRPITLTLPKPLVAVGGKPMLDHCLDRLAEAGIGEAVVNVHHLADRIETHLAGRSSPRIRISDERGLLLETGGGVKRALPLLGPDPFIVMNSDSLWLEGSQSNIARLIGAFDPARMDMLLLLAPTETSLGYAGRGDFSMDAAGLLARRREGARAPYVYAGVAMLKADLFADTPEGAFSLNLLFDRAIARSRLHGLRLDGRWLHVGTPEALCEANEAIAAGAA